MTHFKFLFIQLLIFLKNGLFVQKDEQIQWKGKQLNFHPKGVSCCMNLCQWQDST